MSVFLPVELDACVCVWKSKLVRRLPSGICPICKIGVRMANEQNGVWVVAAALPSNGIYFYFIGFTMERRERTPIDIYARIRSPMKIQLQTHQTTSTKLNEIAVKFGRLHH